jgi:tetratricopeptide (TPR) repeat protein
MKIMRPRGVIATLFLLALALALPGLSAAQEAANPPANALAEAVVRRLAESRGYARIDSTYEKNKATQGEAWTRLPEAQAMFRAREEMLNAARSAGIETGEDGGRVVVFTQGGRKVQLTSVVPSLVEENASTRNDVAGMIARYLVGNASEDANYQAVMAAIDAAENPPLPDIDRRAAPMVLGVFVEAPAPYPLWLPAPGPSSKEKLPPRAEEARQRGLKAAGSGDWPGAVAAFKEANQFAHASPPLMFNLALAYQRGGWPVQAAMYYRAYLAALPDAPNAAEVRAEIPKLIAEIEARSLREFDEAERLVDKLSDTPPSSGVRSLRRTAMESMAQFAYLGGLTDRGDALARKASALPGANETATKQQYPDKRGLYAAAYAWDARQVEDLVARFGNEYTPERIFNYRSYAWARKEDWGEVRKIVDAYPSGLLADKLLGDFWIRQTGAYEVLETMHGLNLDGAKELYVGTLLSDLHVVFWNGRPDIAQRLARRAVEHYRKLNPGGSKYPHWDYTSYLIPNAVLGDRKAIVQEMERWKSKQMDVFLDNSIIETVALYVITSMTLTDAEATIMDLTRFRFKDISISTGANLAEDGWQSLYPLEAGFALAVAKGDSKGALKYLEGTDAPSSKEYQDRVWRALRFAVATGRSQLALDIAEKLPHDWDTLFELNRLAAHPGASESLRERVRRYAVTMSGGWRPVDADHAKKVWLHLKHAIVLKDEKQYGIMAGDAEKTAKERPEQLPADLASHAVALWMGAMAARLED